MSTTLTLRAATGADCSVVLDMAEAMVRESLVPQQPVDRAWCASVIGAVLQDPDSLLLLLEHNGAVAGFAYALLKRQLHNPRLYLHLVHLYVYAPARRAGGARVLIDAVRRWAAPAQPSHTEFCTTQGRLAERDERMWRGLGFNRVGFTLWAEAEEGVAEQERARLL